MYIERINRVLNKVEGKSELEDYNTLLNSLFDYLTGDGELISIDDLIKLKIKEIKWDKESYNYVKLRLKQIFESLQKFYKRELVEINKQIEILIKNQRIINLLSEKVENKKFKDFLIKLKNSLNYGGNEIIELYSELIDNLRSYISKINRNIEDFNKERDYHLLKLIIYNIYFQIKILEEDYRKYKNNINKKVELLNGKIDFLLNKMEENEELRKLIIEVKREID